MPEGQPTRWIAVAALVALALPRLAGATTVGELREIDAPVTAGQRMPALSFEPDPTDPTRGVYLLIWEDDRNDDGTPNGAGSDLYAARIDETGMQLDAGGVNILEAAARPGNQSQPALVFAPAAIPPVHFLAWTDPRNGIQDIYAARFLTSTMSAIPSAGIQITSSPLDTDAFPTVAFGGTTFLVGYQTNTAGGPVQIQAQRLFTDGTLDGTPIRIDNGLNPVATAVGSTYVLGYETALARLRATRIPDAGAVTITTSAVSTSTPSQGLVGLAPVGLDVFAVWQDNRNPDRDIYGSALDPATLMPRSASDTVVARARNNQLSPGIAGHAGGALVVWQDRRNTSSNAQIYGTRLDALGSVRDRDGFPLATFSGNAFEPAVAKGPGQDYLLATIRFGSPSRLYYRVVRDEDPAGTMTASGRRVVLADGVATATVGFGVAQGASGFPVVDGTLYDVTLDSIGPTIEEPDLDPVRPGVQVAALAGTVQVSLRSTTRETVTVSVASVEGTSSGQTTVEFLNVVPVASNIAISPSSPRSVEDLNLTYTYFDVNGDVEMGTEIVWLKNGGTQPAFDNMTTVPAMATARGESWRAWVRPGDGIELNPTRVFSSSVTVGNTPPIAVGAEIVRDNDPSLPTRTGDGISLRYRFSDADLDTEGATRIRWTDRGNPISDLDQATSVPPNRIFKAQVWRATIVPNDGFEDGTAVTTSTLTVVNTTPMSNAGPNQEVIERRRAQLDGTLSSDIDPQDVLQYTWVQASGPVVTLDDPTSPTPSFIAPSVPSDTILRFDLTVSDGEATAPADRTVVDVRAVADADGDGLDDEEEAMAGTDPASRDTDRDQIEDGPEFANLLSPVDADTDDDGLRDGQEGQACRNTCDPAPFEDSDGDGLINALDPDSDDDGLPDGLELGIARPLEPSTSGTIAVGGTDETAGQFVADLDVGTTTDPTVADSDADGLLDGQEDANRNGRIDASESDPNDPLDPGIACSGDADCPGALVCVNGTCGEDMTLTCDPLPDALECCLVACDATSVTTDAVCVANNSRAQCPVAAFQCAAGTCVGAPPPDLGDGCVCARPSDRRTAPFGVLLGVAVLGLRRRRRRSRLAEL